MCHVICYCDFDLSVSRFAKGVFKIKEIILAIIWKTGTEMAVKRIPWLRRQ